MSKRYITEQALSDLTGRALQTIRNDRFRGQGFPYIKIFGKSIRYDLEEVIAIMEGCKVSTSSFPAEETKK